jgi:DNA-binding HxlR family transcriptional regulator
MIAAKQRVPGDTPDAIAAAIRVVAKKWKPAILWLLRVGPQRFGRLQDDLPDTPHKVLIQQLRELECDGIVVREVVAGGGRHVLYRLTSDGMRLLPVLASMGEWERARRQSER